MCSARHRRFYGNLFLVIVPILTLFNPFWVNQSIIFIGPQMRFIKILLLILFKLINRNKKESYYLKKGA